MLRFRALTCVAALAVVGCGSNTSSAGDFQGEERAVAQAVDDLAAAGRQGDAAEVCSRLLAQDMVDSMRAGDRTCAQELEDSLGDADDFDMEVEDVTVSGSTATARVKNGDSTATLRFVKQEGRWKLAEV